MALLVLSRTLLVTALLMACLPGAVVGDQDRPGPVGPCLWQVDNYAIEEPLCGLVGDADRGRAIAIDTRFGNCLACHVLPIPEEPFHGTVGPPLTGIGARYSAAQIRLRIVDERQLNPITVMPGYYRDPAHFNRVAASQWGKTLLTAQQVEDLVAYLAGLQ